MVISIFKILLVAVIYAHACVLVFTIVPRAGFRYIRCMYVYNKVDMVSIEEVDKLARLPHSVVISVRVWIYIVSSLMHLPTCAILSRVCAAYNNIDFLFALLDRIIIPDVV